MSDGNRWRLVIDKAPAKILSKLPRDLMRRLDQKILSLIDNPRPTGCKRLQGYDDLYRIRVGDWRIIYQVRDAELVVLVIEVAARGSAYRDF